MAPGAGHGVQARLAARLQHGHAGERAAQLGRRAGGADHGRADVPPAADRALPVDLRPAAPAAGQQAVARAGAERGRALAEAAADGFAAVLADEGEPAAGAGHLDQHGPGGQRGADQLEDLVRQPRRPRRGVAGQRAVVVPAHPDPRRGVAHGDPVLGDRPQPAPARRRPAARPCGRTRRRGRRRRSAPRGPPAPRGCAGRAPAARPTGRRRRPTARPGRGRAPGRTRRRGCRRPRCARPCSAARKAR